MYAAEQTDEARLRCEKAAKEGKRVAVLCEDGIKNRFEGFSVLNLGETETQMANRLYNLLREAEKICDVLIAVEPKKKDGVMVGVLNRLKKACTSADIRH